MTKEKLEKEAEEIYTKTDKEFMDCQDEGEIFNLGYLAGAEPREKQIEIDAEQIRNLQKQNGELTDKVKELEAQTMQWHDLAKNPNDLPKYCTEVWCDYGEGYGKGFYHKNDGGWWIEGHMFCSAIDAWCELPKRDKGE